MKKGILELGIIVLLMVSYVGLSASGTNEYSMNKELCAKYISLARGAVDDGNLLMAKAYAKKALQANSWDKLAWANYEDIVLQMAVEGEIQDFGAVLEESQAQAQATGDSGEEAPQLEGC
jgi:hypothetical protein